METTGVVMYKFLPTELSYFEILSPTQHLVIAKIAIVFAWVCFIMILDRPVDGEKSR